MEVSRQGLLPYGHIFGKVNTQLKTPVNAYVLQYVLSILFIFGPPPGAVYQFVVAFAAYPVYVCINKYSICSWFVTFKNRYFIF